MDSRGVYFGLAEDEDLYDDDEDGPRAGRSRAALPRAAERAPLDRQRGRGQVEVEDIFPRGRRRPPRGRARRATRAADGGAAPRRGRVGAEEVAKVHLIAPRSFNDAQQIADRFKRDIPVIINLQTADAGSASA